MAIEKHTTPIFKKDLPDDSHKIQPLPQPTGAYPYHLNLKNVTAVTADARKLVFHMVGDTGNVTDPRSQQLVVDAMARQYEGHLTDEERPKFLYHLGDIVYHHGQAARYARQFFEPYRNYPEPIFAIAGNHDSEVDPEDANPYRSLDAFTAVFCDSEPRTVSFSNGAERKSMTQPYVYWTLDTPLATIIGMHSNTPKFGAVSEEQRQWLINELKVADAQRPNKAVILCVHHAPYSADTNHGASGYMIGLLEGVFDQTGIRPDLVLSGHVHNYQRFQKHYADGSLTYIVAGSGGFSELHSIAATDDARFTADSPLLKDVDLVTYNEAAHGFLKISVEKGADQGLLITGEYYAMPHPDDVAGIPQASLFDRFEVTASV